MSAKSPSGMRRNVVVRRSPIHGRGVFAARRLPKGFKVIQYRGRLCTHDEAETRHGGDIESGHTFLFTLNDQFVIDASEGGNSARWINHSCSPNCDAYIYEDPRGDRARDRVFIETRRALRKGEELTYDYCIVPEERLTPTLKKLWPCRCGSRKCAGTLLKPKR